MRSRISLIGVVQISGSISVNTDLLRQHPKALEIIQSFSNQAKPIAVICHAPWVLINAERIQAEQLTSHKNIRLDLENAGAIWVDEAVHTCNAGGWTHQFT